MEIGFINAFQFLLTSMPQKPYYNSRKITVLSWQDLSEMEFLQRHQLNVMLFLSGICGVLAFLAFLSYSMDKKRRRTIMFMEIYAAILLLADRFSYIFRGDTSPLGFWMVKTMNFIAYLMMLFIMLGYNSYLGDLYTHEGNLKKMPVRLYVSYIFLDLGLILLIVSQFTGLYYTIDENNLYHRAPGLWISYFLQGCAILLQISVLITNFDRIPRRIRIPLILFWVIPIIAAAAQVFIYGLSLMNITIAAEVALLYIFVLVDMNKTVDHANKLTIEFLKEEQKNMHTMFEQTAQALALAIDAKDPYTHGHSARVAEYSKRIAVLAGKNEKECEEVYFAGLLHDVGKIGIPISIINKEGKLTDEEYAVIKTHPVIGKQILSSITQSPYLSIGANYHHERYDGRGYPEGLKGTDIPDIARMIAVADAYDAMTSKRSYREPIPQQTVREEIIKGSGTQFDPVYANLMLHLIDKDTEYQMQEHGEIAELSIKDGFACGEYRSVYSEGIHITKNPTKITLHSKPAAGFPPEKCMPSFVLFDSLDARIHKTEDKIKKMFYTEYGEICFDGSYKCKEARKMQAEISERHVSEQAGSCQEYTVTAVRFDDHLLIEISSRFKIIRIITALPDSTRFVYLGLTGEHCQIYGVDIKRDEKSVDENFIPRIAEKISFIEGPSGDIPNIQIDNWRSAATKGIKLKDELEISFHTKSLPTARLVWHCPFVNLFYSDDGMVNGKNYNEFTIMRLDGENWESHSYIENQINVNKTEDFEGWDKWKELNKKGMDCTVHFKRKGNSITMHTVNGGIAIKSVTKINEDVPGFYVALTGDQCALTNIRINASLK